MLFNPNHLYEGISRNYSFRSMGSEPNINARLIDKIDTTNNSVSEFFLKLSKFNKKVPRSNFSKKRDTVFYDDMDFKHYHELLMLKSTPIEENKRKIKKKGDENLYRVMSAERRKYIYNRKLKPTPFQKNRAKYIFEKRAVLINQYLHFTSDIDNLMLKSVSSSPKKYDIETKNIFKNHNENYKNIKIKNFTIKNLNIKSLKIKNLDNKILNNKNLNKKLNENHFKNGFLTSRSSRDKENEIRNNSNDICLTFREKNDNSNFNNHKVKQKFKAQNYFNAINLKRAEKIIKINKLKLDIKRK